jgi:hypothetical protein
MPLKAQYTFAFMPEIQGRTIDGIYKVRIGNTGAKQNVSLTITVTEARSGAIVTIKTPAFELMPGMNSTPPNAAYNAVVGFGVGKLATVVSQSGFFPEGDYDYCFQLYDGAAHSSNLLAESEIWDFKVDCERDSTKLPAEAFRSLEDLSKGNFYIARGQLLFAFNNTYEAATLEYSIRCLTKPEQQVKKLPKVKVARGLNQVVIDISENKSFTDGYFYIMDVKLPDGTQKQLRFIYKTADEK